MISTLKFISYAVASTQMAKKYRLKQRKIELRDFLDGNSRLSFPKPKKPRLTILIPVFNHAYHTLQCLLSLIDIAEDWLEILILDDGSTDETERLLSKVDNISARRNVANMGFIRSVNEGFNHAQGEFVVLLNNDTRFLKGSLNKALNFFEIEKNCGLMGGRIALACGGLQEAGGMIYRNGKTNGYLRHHSVDDPRSLSTRDVDYCSGVFMIIRRDTFLELGGFDERYKPAYYEDTDLCMRLRQLGLRCIYNPDLLVEHFEFGSASLFGNRALIRKNRKVFVEKWKATLEADNYFPSAISTSNIHAAHRLQSH